MISLFIFFLIGFLLLITSIGITCMTKFDNFLYFNKNKNLMFLLNKNHLNVEYLRKHWYVDRMDFNRDWTTEDFDAFNQQMLSLRILKQYDYQMDYLNVSSIIPRNHYNIRTWKAKWPDLLGRFDIVRSGSWDNLPFVDVDLVKDPTRANEKFFFIDYDDSKPY